MQKNSFSSKSVSNLLLETLFRFEDELSFCRNVYNVEIYDELGFHLNSIKELVDDIEEDFNE